MTNLCAMKCAPPALALVMLIAGSSAASTGSAFGGPPADPVANELQVKAAFVYNFAKFTEWPTPRLTAGAPFVIGVLGKDTIVSYLEQTVEGKSLEGHPSSVRRVNNLAEARNCHILFFASSLNKHSKEILDGLQEESVLTVGENDEFSTSGGEIYLYLENNRVGFAINVAALNRSHLKVSSKLLKLAKLIDRPKERN